MVEAANDISGDIPDGARVACEVTNLGFAMLWQRHHRDHADFHESEKCANEFRPIVELENYPVERLKPGLHQHEGKSVHLLQQVQRK